MGKKTLSLDVVQDAKLNYRAECWYMSYRKMNDRSEFGDSLFQKYFHDLKKFPDLFRQMEEELKKEWPKFVSKWTVTNDGRFLESDRFEISDPDFYGKITIKIFYSDSDELIDLSTVTVDGLI